MATVEFAPYQTRKDGQRVDAKPVGAIMASFAKQADR
jgi:hypothetical protein